MLPKLPGRRFLFQPSSGAGGQGPCLVQRAPYWVLAVVPGLWSCLLDCACWDFGCSLETHEGLGADPGSMDIPGGTAAVGHPVTPPSPIPGCSQPRCRGAQPQPTSCLAPGCPVVLSFIFIYLYGECNKTPAGNGGDSLPFPASRPWAGANKEAHCAAQTCLPVLSCARGRGAKKGLCVSVSAPGPSANTRLSAAGSLAALRDGVSWGRSFASGGKQGWG